MNNKAFEIPQRQSTIGVLFIFLTTLYKIARGLWIFFAYILFKGVTKEGVYILWGLLFVAILSLLFSILNYRNFKFHINYKSKEFVLEKGVLSTELINIPFDKIQQVYFKRSLLQQIINVYSVVVDTAGSSKKEINIKALSREKANSLREILMELAEAETEENQFISEEKEATAKEERKSVSWTYKLTLSSLIKIGLTSNYIRGIWLLLIFLTTIQNELNSLPEGKIYVDKAFDYLENNFSEILQIYAVLFFFLLVMFVLGIFITFVEVFIKYYGLELTQTHDTLDLQMGLKTNTRTSLKPKRVQLLKENTNPIQKYLNLYEVQLSVASSEDTLNKNTIKIPGLRKEHLHKINYFLYKKEEENFTIYKPNIIWLFRNLYLTILPVFVILIGVNYFFEWLNWWNIASILMFYGILVGIFQYLAYNKTSLRISANFIEKKIWRLEPNHRAFRTV
ncbi:PH domain-containing protein [Mesonia maritima]|uniref:PH domain-containing protein n=1 Tax=Mesonia maritima TaxID=1793873 RepID=UPI003638274B